MARLSPQKKRRLKRRAAREASREHQVPSMAPAIGQANREYGREVADARGAHRAYQSAINRMLGSLGGSGMGPKYANQLRKDLTLRKAESAAGVPYAVAQAQQRRSDAIASAREEVSAAQQARQNAMGVRYTDLLETARKNKVARVEKRRDAVKQAEKDMRGVRNAMVIARSVFQGAKPEHKRLFLQNPDAFAAKVAENTKGADASDARKAVNRLFKRIARGGARGAFENVYGPQEWPKPKRRRRR